jgi:hypothetical protein
MFIDYCPDKTTVCYVCQERKLCQWKAAVKKYLCDQCLAQGRYSIKNGCVKGQKQKRLPTFSVEFEVQPPSQEDEQQIEQALLLLRHHFLRTADSTVSDEYKSPLYLSLTAFYPALEVMSRLQHLVGDDCGTHLHVECHVKEELQCCLGEVFGPLVGHLLAHPHESFLFWGRGLNRYALHLPLDRYFLFNTTSDHPTLEFRLPRFRSKEQFLAVVKFARSCTTRLEQKLPLAKKKPLLLPTLGQELLCLYQSFLPQPGQLTWLDALKEKPAALLRQDYGWRKHC